LNGHNELSALLERLETEQRAIIAAAAAARGLPTDSALRKIADLELVMAPSSISLRNRAMALETIFVVESRYEGDAGELIADAPVQCPSADEAVVMAHLVVGSREGVVAFQRTGDVALGEYDRAVILVQLGSVLDPLE
jgi:hypothetical protein